MASTKPESKVKPAGQHRGKRASQARTAGKSAKPESKPVVAASPARHTSAPSSKQDIAPAMLRQTDGTTIATIVRATSWQTHSVRGFLAGVVKQKAGLKLASGKTGKERVCRISAQGTAS